MGAPQPPVTPMTVTFCRWRQDAFVAGMRPARPRMVCGHLGACGGGQPVTAGAGPRARRRRAGTCAAGAKEAAQAAAPSNSLAVAPVSVTADPLACLRSIGDHRGPPPVCRAGPPGPASRRRALEACTGNCHRSRSQDHTSWRTSYRCCRARPGGLKKCAFWVGSLLTSAAGACYSHCTKRLVE
jgi:hypothetical protein